MKRASSPQKKSKHFNVQKITLPEESAGGVPSHLSRPEGIEVVFQVVIPARHASTRLPGKPLLLISGKPMVVRVAEQAAKSGAQQIWIATDHHAIANAVHEHGFKACLTKDSHPAARIVSPRWLSNVTGRMTRSWSMCRVTNR